MIFNHNAVKTSHSFQYVLSANSRIFKADFCGKMVKKVPLTVHRITVVPRKRFCFIQSSASDICAFYAVSTVTSVAFAFV